MTGRLVEHYKSIHETRRYGNTSIKNFKHLASQAATLPQKAASVIDFGCGQSTLVDQLAAFIGAEPHRYDPAIEEFSAKPDKVFDLLLNTDVLEHIPEEEIDPILAEMRGMCRHALFIIDMKLAKEILPNGQNAHCSVFPEEWWRAKLLKHFDVVEPIAVQSEKRASFRTWSHSPGDKLTYAKARAGFEMGRLMNHLRRRSFKSG